MKLYSILFSLIMMVYSVEGQNNYDSSYASHPYTLHAKKDIPVTVAALVLTGVGTKLIANKKPLDQSELVNKTPDKVNGFDRSSAGWYSESADKASYIPFGASFAFPVIGFLINGNERSEIGKVFFLYTQTMAITGAIYTMTAGTVIRSRPLVYGTLAPLDVRLSKNNQRSFFAGHTAASAAACFFTAKVFADYNPDSYLKPYVWGTMAVVPAIVGYLRYKAGMHFLSDNIIGYAVGGAVGILVPKMHKSKIFKNVTFLPEAGNNYKGIAINYYIK